MSFSIWLGLWKSPDNLRWEENETEAAVYNPSSGSTHLLNHAAIEAIQLLQQQPLSEGELTRRLGELQAIKPNDEFTKSIRQILTDFDHLGLIESFLENQ